MTPPRTATKFYHISHSSCPSSSSSSPSPFPLRLHISKSSSPHSPTTSPSVSPQIPDADALWIANPLFFSCQDPQRTRRLASQALLRTPPLRTHFYCLGSAPSPFVCFPSSFCLATTAVPSLVFLFLPSHRPYRLLPSLHLHTPSSRLGYNSFCSFSLQHLSAIAVWVCPR